MHKAEKTLAAIDAAIEKDQGNNYRFHLSKQMPLQQDAYAQTNPRSFRTHLGASILGRDCAREIWYSFRWATTTTHSARMNRLFNRGHLEEARMVAALLCVPGIIVYQFDSNGNQYRIKDSSGHVGGGLDGVAVGLPDSPFPTLLEFKTHNTKSYGKLETDGVMKTKWEHFVQMQMYMGGLHLAQALYLATNKDDDSLHGEIVKYDQAVHRKTLDRAFLIVNAKEAPPKINASAAFFKCKFCDARGVCHGNEPVEKTCRSCVHAQVGKTGGEWWCTLHSEVLSKDRQHRGCERYSFNQTAFKA